MEITTTTGALLAGLVTSLHCAGMCGPIACGVGTLAKTEGERMMAATVYHLGRLISYGIIGAICGAIGTQPLKWFFDSPAVLLPWALVVALLLITFGLDKKIPRPAILNRFTARTRFRAGRFSSLGASSLMGLLTPLLPCGPLYVVFGVALLSGSPAKGAEFTLAFGLGQLALGGFFDVGGVALEVILHHLADEGFLFFIAFRHRPEGEAGTEGKGESKQEGRFIHKRDGFARISRKFPLRLNGQGTAI